MKFIFKIKIKNGYSEQEYIDAWKKGSAVIQKSLGAKGTTLYRKIDESGVLIAMAEWDSRDLRDAAIKKLNQDPETIINRHREIGEMEIIGNFEEIAKVEPS